MAKSSTCIYDVINCNGCTICCQWGDQASQIKPSPELPVTPEGNCGYLIEGRGCAVHGTPLQPMLCRMMDCRHTYSRVKHSPLIKVALKGKEMLDTYGEPHS